jgi:hypothetical protein
MPLASRYAGRTIIQPGIDQAYLNRMTTQGQSQDKGNPEPYYIHDILPTQQGIKSVAYQLAAQTQGVSVDTFDRILPVRDSSDNIGFIGITTDARTFILSSYAPSWAEITPVGQPATVEVTIADATGQSFICYPGFDIFIVDIIHSTLIASGISWGAMNDANSNAVTNASILGIASCYNILLAHDGYTIYSSSVLSPTDFNPSLSTGAQSLIPSAMNGKIIVIMPVGIGFAVFTSANIVAAQYAGQTQNPWIFKPLPNSAGIKSVTAVSSTGADGTVYAWTTSGLLQVSVIDAKTTLPALTDLLSSRIFEDFDDATGLPFDQMIYTDMHVRIAYANSRYIVISYGPTQPMAYAYIYDIALGQFGKLRQSHVCVCEFLVDPDGTLLSFNDLSTLSYADLGIKNYSNLAIMSNSAASPKRTLAMLTQSGSIFIPVIDEFNYSANACIIMGYYRLIRNRLIVLQTVLVENINSDNFNYTVDAITSLNGKDVASIVPLVDYTESMGNLYQAGNSSIAWMLGYAYGVDLSLRIRGAFNLVSLEMRFTLDGDS